MQKNLPKDDAYFRIFIRFWLDLIAWVRFLLRGEFKFTAAISKAHYHFLINLNQTAEKRTQTQVPYLNHTGVYKQSVVYNYFVKKIKKFSQLPW